ncbi:MAG: hypothetical protein PHQ34_13930 [Methanothrix sp.]|nr:hypothetical protein [Methanothrix sp.]
MRLKAILCAASERPPGIRIAGLRRYFIAIAQQLYDFLSGIYFHNSLSLEMSIIRPDRTAKLHGQGKNGRILLVNFFHDLECRYHLFPIMIQRDYLNGLKNELSGVFEGQMHRPLFSLGLDIVLVPVDLFEPVIRKVNCEVP